MTNIADRNWYVFAYYDISNTAVFVGMEQEVPGDDVSTKYSSCTKLDSSKGYRFSDTELSRVVGAKVIGYGMSRDEADMAVKVTRNLILDCMPRSVSDNMLKVRFVKEVGVEVSTGALEDSSALADSYLESNNEEAEDTEAASEVDSPEPNAEQEDIRLRLEHTKSLLLHTIASKSNNKKYADFYLEASERLRAQILELGKTPADGLSGPAVLAKRSSDELYKSLDRINEYQKQYKFECTLPELPSVIDTSDLSIDDDEDDVESTVKASSISTARTKASEPAPIKGATRLSDEEFNAVVEDFTRSIAKRNKEEADKLMGIKKPHPLDNLEFDDNYPPKKSVPKSFERVVEEDSSSNDDSDLGELDEQLRLTHYKMILLQVKARRLGREDLVDKYANKAENLRKQILALAVSEEQDMASISVVGRMKNSELAAAIKEVKQIEDERNAPVKKARDPKEELEDLRIANNIDQEIIRHQKKTGTGSAKERNILRKKINERKERIEELEG